MHNVFLACLVLVLSNLTPCPSLPVIMNFILTCFQTMLKSLYDHFVVLYDAVLPQEPSLASEHALRQEEEIYNRASKLTYRNV